MDNEEDEASDGDLVHMSLVEHDAVLVRIH